MISASPVRHSSRWLRPHDRARGGWRRPGAEGPPAHAAARLRLALANKGHDTRAIQGCLGHRSITRTAVYTALAPNRFKDFWRD
jgi:integrase